MVSPNAKAMVPSANMALKAMLAGVPLMSYVTVLLSIELPAAPAYLRQCMHASYAHMKPSPGQLE